MPKHLDEEILELYVLGRLSPIEVPKVRVHLSSCLSCQARAMHEADIAIDILSTADSTNRREAVDELSQDSNVLPKPRH
jgi:hypothetical protein